MAGGAEEGRRPGEGECASFPCGDGGERKGNPQEVRPEGLVGRVYDTATSVWAWGRTIPAAGSVLGFYEGAASLTVAAATGGRADLPSIDRGIRSWIGGLDRDVVGPALRQLLRLLNGWHTRQAHPSLEDGPPPSGNVEERREMPPEVAGDEIPDQRPDDDFLHHLDDQVSSLDDNFRRRASEAALRARQLRVVVMAPLLDLLGEELPPPVYHKTHEEKSCVQEALAASIIFSRLDDSVRQTLIDAFEPVTVNEGTAIIQEGDKGDFFYVLQSGKVSVTSNKDNSPVGSISEGESFGEIALLFDCPRVVTCTAETDCRVLRLDRDTFRRIVEGIQLRRDGEMMALLKKVPMFQGFDDNLLTRIACLFSTQKFCEGDVIFRKGEEAEMFCIVKEGKVKATNITSGGRRFDDYTFGVGEHFGEEGILQKSSHICNAIALEQTTILCALRAAFVKAMGPYADILSENLDQKTLKAVPIENKPKLTQSDVEILASAIVDSDYEANHIFYKEGTRISPALFLVRSGQVSVTNSSGLNKVITKGGYFGNGTLGGDISKPFVAKRTLVAKEKCRVGVLKGEDISSVLHLSRCDKLDLQDITKHKILGEGTFGQVWCVSKKDSSSEDRAFALKVQYKRQLIESELAESAIREKNMMATINSDFVIRLVGTNQDEHRIFMLMRLYQGGELWSLIHHGDRHGLPESVAKFYASNVLLGLTHMHRRRILHRDIKPSNVLLDNDGWAVIIDLGTAKFVPGKTYSFCGTPLYLAPEVIQRTGHDKGADLWSWGVMLFEMLFGMTPFDDPDATNQMDIFKNIVNGSFCFPPGSLASASAKDLIKKVLAVEPQDRLGNLARGVKDLQQHAWFESISFLDVTRKDIVAPWIPHIRDAIDTRNFESGMYADKKCWEELPLNSAEQEMFEGF